MPMQTWVMQRSETAFIGFPIAAIAGAVLLFGLISWVLWRESIATEEQRLAELWC